MPVNALRTCRKNANIPDPRLISARKPVAYSGSNKAEAPLREMEHILAGGKRAVRHLNAGCLKGKYDISGTFPLSLFRTPVLFVDDSICCERFQIQCLPRIGRNYGQSIERMVYSLPGELFGIM